jgi:hypothetical protein
MQMMLVMDSTLMNQDGMILREARAISVRAVLPEEGSPHLMTIGDGNIF